MSGSSAQKIIVAYEVPDGDESWELGEENVPESVWHDAVIELLKLVLRAWASRTHANALIASNLALRWNRKRWKVGVDPDVALYVPSPPEGEDATSVCTWEPGHGPPRVAVEVVSHSTASKDYVTGPDQYAASGTSELWVFDPKRHGPKEHGGPFLLQVWRRDESNSFRQIYRGNGPFESPEMGAWLVVTHRGMRLRLADDREGNRLWPTAAEAAEQQVFEAERQMAAAGRQVAAAERQTTALEAEVAKLRAELERLRNP